MPSPGILDPSLIACDTYGHAILDKLDGLGVVASALGVDRVPIYKGVNVSYCPSPPCTIPNNIENYIYIKFFIFILNFQVVGSSETIYTRDFIKGELCYLVS